MAISTPASAFSSTFPYRPQALTIQVQRAHQNQFTHFHPTASRSTSPLPSPITSNIPSGATAGIYAPSLKTMSGLLSDAFSLSHSRVLQLVITPISPTQVSFRVLQGTLQTLKKLGPALWEVYDNKNSHSSSFVLIFDTHEEACTALSLSNPSLHLLPALESDLDTLQLQGLQRVHFDYLEDMICPAVFSEYQKFSSVITLPSQHANTNDSSILSPFNADATAATFITDFNISSNPPNPKMSFRAGDWICSSPNCLAHNFGRNVMCIRCGTARTTGGSPPSTRTTPFQPLPHHVSPRFVPRLPTVTSPSSVVPSSEVKTMGRPSAPCYPILTPSGKALSAGGRVRNISTDPLAPCIMYWPDNEALPDNGQIRPLGSAATQFPPIINTGNKGAAEKQPGDWYCTTCNYLNWRRRKVCQTCYPYAEGNGDSIPASVQAERIALLTAQLNQIDPSSLPLSQGNVSTTSFSVPPTPALSLEHLPPRHVPRSQYHHLGIESQVPPLPIYQTSRQPPLTSRLEYPGSVIPSYNLLPSCLQDVIQSPLLSPTTSSASTSPENSHDGHNYELFTESYIDRDYCHPYSPGVISNASDGSIWRLNDEESKTFALSGPKPGNNTACVTDLVAKFSAGLSFA